MSVIQIKSKSKEDQEEDNLRRFKEKTLFVVALASIVITIFSCITFLIFNPDSPSSSIALNGLISLTMGLLGYYLAGSKR